MEIIPTLVQDLNLRVTTNSVCVATVKYTLDQFDEFLTTSNPAPAKLGRQITSLRGAYGVMNDAYALQMKSLDTQVIHDLDVEGDQLLYGIRGILEGAVRMTFDADRLRLSQTLWEAYRKYRIDPTENMIAEWGKAQQFCEEYLGSSLLQQSGAALSLDGAIRRLAAVADEIRRLMTQRNAEMPEAQAMKNAREAVYPEYRLAILLLNAYAATDDNVHAYDALILNLNRNIDYLRKHAITGASGSGTSAGNGSEGNNGQNGQGGSEGTTDSGNQGGTSGGDNGGSSQGGSTGGDNGGSTGGDNGGSTGGDNGGSSGGGDNGGGGGSDWGNGSDE